MTHTPFQKRLLQPTQKPTADQNYAEVRMTLSRLSINKAYCILPSGLMSHRIRQIHVDLISIFRRVHVHVSRETCLCHICRSFARYRLSVMATTPGETGSALPYATSSHANNAAQQTSRTNGVAIISIPTASGFSSVSVHTEFNVVCLFCS